MKHFVKKTYFILFFSFIYLACNKGQNTPFHFEFKQKNANEYTGRVVIWVTNLNDLVKNTENSMGRTPAHPSYPSGHSTFSEAANVVLTDIFGSNFAFIDRSYEGRKDFLSMPRSFKNFDEMSRQNTYFHIPLGVHYRMDCEEGLRIGKIIGDK